MLDVNVATLKRQGERVDDAKLAAMAEELPRSLRSRDRHPIRRLPSLWVDAIIDPAKTRDVLILALDVAVRNREAVPLGTGVFQV